MVSPGLAVDLSAVLVTSSSTRATVTGITPMLSVLPGPVPKVSEPYQVSPASISGSSQKVRIENGVPAAIGPAGAFGGQVARVTGRDGGHEVGGVRATGSGASQFWTRTHQVPAAGVATSHASSEPPEALWHTTLASVTGPVPTNMSKSGAVGFSSFAISREAPAGTSTSVTTIAVAVEGVRVGAVLGDGERGALAGHEAARGDLQVVDVDRLEVLGSPASRRHDGS